MNVSGSPTDRPMLFNMARSVVISLLIGLLMFLLAVITVMQVRLQVMRSFADLRETRDFQATTNLVLREVVDFETAYRGYLLTRADAMLRPGTGASQDLENYINTLNGMVERESDFAPIIERISTLARTAAADIQSALEANRAGTETLEQRNERLLAINGRVEELRAATETFHAQLRDQLLERRESMSGIISLLLTAIIVLLTGIAVSSLALLKEVSRKNAEALEAGRMTADTISSLTTHLDLSRLETNLMNKRLAMAIQSAKTAVFTIDREGKIHWMSASAESPLSGSEAETSLEPRVAPVFRPEFRRRLAQTFAGHDPVAFDLALENDPDASLANERWMRFNLVPPTGQDSLALGSAIDITDIRRREAANFLLMRELSHRSKNLLAIVQAMARQTAQNAGTLEAFKERFGERLRALAASHDLLVRHNYSGADIRDVIVSQLADRAGLVGNRITLEGRNVFLQPVAAQTFGMAVHELVSNARLFGALSNDSGTVQISWQDGDENGKAVFIVDWQEQGAPPNPIPAKPGFGTMLIATNLPRALNGHVELHHASGGTRCRMVLDLSMVEERARPAELTHDI